MSGVLTGTVSDPQGSYGGFWETWDEPQGGKDDLEVARRNVDSFLAVGHVLKGWPDI